jgi:hypothetical protein
MLGYIITILGGYTTYKLWGHDLALAIVKLIVTLYQLSSLRIIQRENDVVQTTLNMVASLAIIGLFIASFFIKG